ncbi:MAG TPA: hypothetical protein VMT82_01755 [candidate division Zixibacteria bacterium]|nr:hypothetical protein [candidate division Zixibacteria bacterium]
MKLGAENRTETIIAAVLGIIALLMVLRGFVFSPSSKPTPAPARAAAPAAAPAGNRGKATPVLTQSLDPRLRLDLLNSSEQVKYVGKGRNIFRAEAEPVKIEQPKVSPFRQKNAEPVVNTPPPPPPIPLKYFGLASRPGEPTRIFLSEGDSVFVAKEGEIVDRRYKIVHVTPNQVEVEDMLYNNRQSIPLSQG